MRISVVYGASEVRWTPTITPVLPWRTASTPAAPSASTSSKSTLLAACEAQRCSVLSSIPRDFTPSCSLASCDKYCAVPDCAARWPNVSIETDFASKRKLPSAWWTPSLTTTITLFFSRSRCSMAESSACSSRGISGRSTKSGAVPQISCAIAPAAVSQPASRPIASMNVTFLLL